MNQKCILVFCPWAYSTSYYTAQFCNAVASDQNRIFLVAPNNFILGLLSKNVEQINWPYTSPIRTNMTSALQTPGQLIKFIMIVNKIRPDWIHLLWKNHLPVLLKPYLKRFKIGFTVHDPVLHSGESGILRLWIHKKHIEMADIFFVHGENNRKDLIRDFDIDTEKVYKIPHGNIFFWKNEPDIAQEKIILFFGRIKKYKGLEVLLKSFKKAKVHLPGYRLVIRGQGYSADIPSIIDSIPDVDFENRFVLHNEAPELFARAEFVVLPYLEGTQSGVIPMIFAFGKACIVSKVGSIPEVVKNGENGLLVPPGNINALADKMIELANNDNLRKHLENGAQKTSERIDSKYKKCIFKTVTKAYYEN